MNQPSSPVRVVLVDDHAMFRAGVRAELASSGAGVVEVVGEAADADAAIAVVREFQPQVVLLDVHLPGGGGVEVMRRHPSPDTLYLALSVSDAAEDVIGTIRGGARGYAYKEVAKELFISVKTVETHMSSVLRKLQLSSRHELTKWASDRRLL